jgi:hypothetical protein
MQSLGEQAIPAEPGWSVIFVEDDELSYFPIVGWHLVSRIKDRKSDESYTYFSVEPITINNEHNQHMLYEGDWMLKSPQGIFYPHGEPFTDEQQAIAYMRHWDEKLGLNIDGSR